MHPGSHSLGGKRRSAPSIAAFIIWVVALELNLSWVTEDLAVGGRFPIEATEQLARSLSIRAIVDLRREACDDEHILRQHGIRLLHLPTQDCCGIALPQIWEGVRFIDEQLRNGGRVYVHCEHGIGRSPLLTCCFLLERAHSPLAALRLVKSARPCVSPTPDQLQRFLEWTRQWMKGRSVPWRLPDLLELSEIAYSHLHQGA